MHAGEQLKKLLKEARRKPEAFADEIDRSRGMIYNYFSMERFTLELYELFEPVLKKWDIDPSSLNPSAQVSIDSPSEVRALLKGIPKECLPNVRQMINADRGTKIALLALIEDRLDDE